MWKILEKKYISATELKNKTKGTLDATDDLWEVFIMNNNKPRAVLVSVDRYNYMNNFHIPEQEPDMWEKESIQNYQKNWPKSLMKEDDFFNALK